VPGILVLRLDQPLLEIVWPVNYKLILLMLLKPPDIGRALVHSWDVGVQFCSLFHSWGVGVQFCFSVLFLFCFAWGVGVLFCF
jgi:hypothetical protein